MLKVEISEEKEWGIFYYAYLYRKLTTSWYQAKGFYILPEIKNDLPQNSVVFPNHEKIIHSKNFGKLLKSIEVENEYYDEEANIFSCKNTFGIDLDDHKCDKSFLSKLKAVTNTFNDKIIPIIDKLVPDQDFIKKIIIYPAGFGTHSTFFFDKDTIHTTMRSDVRNVLYRLTKIYLYCIFSYTFMITKRRWNERESVIHFLTHESELKEYFKGEIDLFTSVNFATSNKSLGLQSNKYLQKLGFGEKNKMEKRDDFSFIYMGKEIKNLSYNQRIFLNTLLENSETGASYDKISDALYAHQSSDKFSLQYLAKLAEETRDALSEASFPRNRIVAVRKYGYKII